MSIVTLGAGVVMTLRKPAPRPVEGNIQYNRLLREQLAQRNADIAKENVERRRQVTLAVVPLPKSRRPAVRAWAWLRSRLWCSRSGPASSSARSDVTIGPEFGVSGEYREAAADLRYRGLWAGRRGAVTFHRFTAEGSFVSLQMDPTDDSQATESFRATLIDAWLRWEALELPRLRSRSPESLHRFRVRRAVRGRRAHRRAHAGPARAGRGYLVAGGLSRGRAVFRRWECADRRWRSASGWMSAGRACFRGSAQYSFQRFDRKTNPAGGAEVSVPIVQSLARIGLAVAF